MKRYDLFNMSDDEITKAIDDTDFLLYGNFKKEEKKKLMPILEGNDVEMRLETSQWGNRVLRLRIWNPCLKDNDTLYRNYEYEY